MRISDWSSDVCSSDLGRDEALLRLHIGRDRPEQRWLLLIGTVGAAEPLDRSIGFPACFEQILDAAALVRGAKIGMIAAPRSTGRSAEHTSELQSLLRISYAVFCLQKTKKQLITPNTLTKQT